MSQGSLGATGDNNRSEQSAHSERDSTNGHTPAVPAALEMVRWPLEEEEEEDLLDFGRDWEKSEYIPQSPTVTTKSIKVIVGTFASQNGSIFAKKSTYAH